MRTNHFEPWCLTLALITFCAACTAPVSSPGSPGEKFAGEFAPDSDPHAQLLVEYRHEGRQRACVMPATAEVLDRHDGALDILADRAELAPYLQRDGALGDCDPRVAQAVRGGSRYAWWTTVSTVVLVGLAVLITTLSDDGECEEFSVCKRSAMRRVCLAGDGYYRVAASADDPDCKRALVCECVKPGCGKGQLVGTWKGEGAYARGRGKDFQEFVEHPCL